MVVHHTYPRRIAGSNQDFHVDQVFDVYARSERTLRKLRIKARIDTAYPSQSKISVDVFDGDKWNSIFSTNRPEQIGCDATDVYWENSRRVLAPRQVDNLVRTALDIAGEVL